MYTLTFLCAFIKQLDISDSLHANPFIHLCQDLTVACQYIHIKLTPLLTPNAYPLSYMHTMQPTLTQQQTQGGNSTSSTPSHHYRQGSYDEAIQQEKVMTPERLPETTSQSPTTPVTPSGEPYSQTRASRLWLLSFQPAMNDHNITSQTHLPSLTITPSPITYLQVAAHPPSPPHPHTVVSLGVAHTMMPFLRA